TREYPHLPDARLILSSVRPGTKRRSGQLVDGLAVVEQAHRAAGEARGLRLHRRRLRAAAGPSADFFRNPCPPPGPDLDWPGYRLRPLDLVESCAANHSVANLWTKFGEDTIAVTPTAAGRWR